MTTRQMPKELRPLLELAEASRPETVVLTVRRRPVAALVSLRKVDRESLALSTNPRFLGIIEAARKEVRAGKTVQLEALERKFAAAKPAPASRPSARKRRSKLSAD